MHEKSRLLASRFANNRDSVWSNYPKPRFTHPTTEGIVMMIGMPVWRRSGLSSYGCARGLYISSSELMEVVIEGKTTI